MSFIGGNRYRDSWIQRASNSGGFRASSIANTSQIQIEQRGEEKNNNNSQGNNEQSYESMAFQRPKNDFVSTKKLQTQSQQNNNNTNGNNEQQQIPRSQEKSNPLVPKFVETDKQVLRFLCHITEMERGSKRPTPINIRFFTLLVYLEDNTFEIIEDKIPNSGIGGGTFYGRNVLKKNGGSRYLPIDLNIGVTVSAIGQEFQLTDCDQFTRDYYKKSLGIFLNPTIPRPTLPQQQSTSQNTKATRNHSTIFSPSTTIPTQADNKTKPNLTTTTNTRTTTTKNFYTADPRILRFNSIEVDTKYSSNVTITGSSTPKSYGLLFYLADETMEVRLLNRTAHDEAQILVKRQQIPKNYLELDPFNPGNEIFFQSIDLICGTTVDVLGRKFLILTCDEMTREYYQNLNIEQKEIVVEAPSILHPSSRSRADSKSNEGTLASLQIGERERVSTGGPGGGPGGGEFRSKEFIGVTLRCKCQLLTGERGVGGREDQKLTDSTQQQQQQLQRSQRPQSAGQNFRRGQSQSLLYQSERNTTTRPPTGQWFQSDGPPRLLLLTFYFEDTTLTLNEENTQNSLQTGVGTGKSFLRRNKYPNESTGRDFDERDVYLGNVVRINGFLMKIVEMDESSCRYCEDQSDEENYTFFNIYLVTDLVLDKVMSIGINLRNYFKQFDSEEKGFIPLDDFLSCLQREPIEISSFLNEQQISTLLRSYSTTTSTTTADTTQSKQQTRNSTNSSKIFHYLEFCDLLSKRYFLHNTLAGEEDYPRQRSTPPWSTSTNENKKSSFSSFGPSSSSTAPSPLLSRYLTELRSRSILWRSVIRQSSDRIGSYIILTHLIAIMEDNGCRLSSTILGEIISKYSLPQQEANTILQVKDQFQRRNGNTSSSNNNNNQRRPSSGFNQRDEKSTKNEYDLERIVIDYQIFCDEIYPFDWKMANTTSNKTNNTNRNNRNNNMSRK